MLWWFKGWFFYWVFKKGVEFGYVLMCDRCFGVVDEFVLSGENVELRSELLIIV